ncbi:Pyruvate kinase [hydrothermal vent metagenome]|uniref:pyruvate kinase n=1 Tax=hydrothermal vent metagenome TaxID=652676 RepID=A0A3B1E5J4_9ZZZZ
MGKKTKILATVGPASDKVEILEGLIKAGVDVFRMNFSHGTHESHSTVIKNIRQAIKNTKKNIGILQDISGPKVRVGKIDGKFELEKDDVLYFHKKEISSYKDDSGYNVSITQPSILDLLNIDEYIYLCDGKIRTKVVQTGDVIKTIVEGGGVLSSNKGVNFPNTTIDIDIITEKDKKDIKWGIENNVDFMAISFVQSAKDVLYAREIIDSHNGDVQVFSKIEKFDAVDNIDEIIKVSDGIMVARGDLGIEIPYFKVPAAQKKIIKKANEASKPVITATQMMLSMVENEVATRAEVSDVANAVLDGTDAVMLSEESAIGVNPIRVVETMTDTIKEIEKIYPYYKLQHFKKSDSSDVILSSTATIVQDLDIEAILAFTYSGTSARRISKYRPDTPIYAVAHSSKVARAMSICWGVYPVTVLPQSGGSENLQSSLIKDLNNLGLLDLNKKYLLTAGHPMGIKGSTNLVRVFTREELEYYLNK